MTVAYSYVRFSTAEQAKGDGLDRQRQAAAGYAERRGLALDTSYVDSGVSAHRGRHVAIGAFGRFVAAVEEGRVPRGSVLLVEAFDRFSRQETLDALELLNRLLRLGVEIVTLEDGAVYSRATMREGTQLIVAAIKMQSSFEFSQRLGRRVRSAWSRKRGEAATRKLTKWCPAWLELLPDRSGYVEKDGRFATVRLIFQLYADGLGYDGIARELNARNVPTFENLGKRPTAAGWQTGYVNRILQNRAVIGEYQPCVRPVGDDGLRRPEPVGEPVAGYFPAAIDRTLWDRAAAARNRRGDGKGGAGGTGGPKRAIVCANTSPG
ncbi:MAG: recombinase family protein [Acetobacteraceae bacterium]|nr:recombinase family protein [Acetobacteraceae bacterium]